MRADIMPTVNGRGDGYERLSVVSGTWWDQVKEVLWAVLWPGPRPATKGVPQMADYPTDEELHRIETWPFEDKWGWFGFIEGRWTYRSWGWREEEAMDDLFDRPVHRYYISTGGWSGNEDIIDAMSRNLMLWMLTWQQSRRGGHYIFEVPAAAETAMKASTP
jgi:hypothetical protein